MVVLEVDDVLPEEVVSDVDDVVPEVEEVVPEVDDVVPEVEDVIPDVDDVVPDVDDAVPDVVSVPVNAMDVDDDVTVRLAAATTDVGPSFAALTSATML